MSVATGLALLGCITALGTRPRCARRLSAGHSTLQPCQPQGRP